MAKIEMDLSEYEALKENKKLLEVSLEKERELQGQIKKLTGEKIKALEDARMKVIKISKTEIREHLLRKREDRVIWRELLHLLGLDYRRFPNIPVHIHTDYLIDALFEKTKSISMPVEETTTHGLDEIKAEIRNDLKAEMDDETKRRIRDAEIALSKNDELLREIRTLTSHNDLLLESNKKLTERCDDLVQKLTTTQDQNIIVAKIKFALKDGYGFWNKSKLLNRIISIINPK